MLDSSPKKKKKRRDDGLFEPKGEDKRGGKGAASVSPHTHNL